MTLFLQVIFEIGLLLFLCCHSGECNVRRIYLVASGHMITCLGPGSELLVRNLGIPCSVLLEEC